VVVMNGVTGRVVLNGVALDSRLLRLRVSSERA
jgi:hypothetical protein